jgi:hypothetical protein
MRRRTKAYLDISNVVLLKEIYRKKCPFSARCIGEPTVARNIIPNESKHEAYTPS